MGYLECKGYVDVTYVLVLTDEQYTWFKISQWFL